MDFFTYLLSFEIPVPVSISVCLVIIYVYARLRRKKSKKLMADMDKLKRNMLEDHAEILALYTENLRLIEKNRQLSLTSADRFYGMKSDISVMPPSSN